MYRTLLYAIRSSLKDEVLTFAGFAAYSGLLSLFPFLIFLVALASFVGGAHLADTLIEKGFAFFPETVMQTLSPVVRETVRASEHRLLTLSAVGALWVASSGIESLRSGLNVAHHLVETRPLWWRRGQGIALVLGGAVVSLLLTALIVALPLALNAAADLVGLTLDPSQRMALNATRYGLALSILSGFILILYRLLPNTDYTLRQLLPGALIASILWLILASLFTLYLAHFGRYNITYGSLGGIIVTLIFFHLSIAVILFGGEINAALHQSETKEAMLAPPAAIQSKGLHDRNKAAAAREHVIP